MTADAIDSAGRRFELLDVRPVSCLGLAFPTVVVGTRNCTIFMSLADFIVDGWRFAPRSEQPRAHVAKPLGAA